MLDRMPPQKQEQLVAELAAQSKRREAMTEEERKQEDQEMMVLHGKFNALLQSLDNQQRNAIIHNLQNLMPSSQMAYMKQLVAGGVEAILPPSKDELKSWKGVYLCYFNRELSKQKGRRLPLEYCVRNPRPDEVLQALAQIGLKSVFEQVRPSP